MFFDWLDELALVLVVGFGAYAAVVALLEVSATIGVAVPSGTKLI